MISRRKAIAFMSLAGSAAPALARTKKPSTVGRFNTDRDRTVDLAEATRAASEVFDKLEPTRTARSTSKNCKAA
jgi:hypothetical protein